MAPKNIYERGGYCLNGPVTRYAMELGNGSENFALNEDLANKLRAMVAPEPTKEGE